MMSCLGEAKRGKGGKAGSEEEGWIGEGEMEGTYKDCVEGVGKHDNNKLK